MFNKFYLGSSEHIYICDILAYIFCMMMSDAWIMAASTLSKHGIDDFLILEATERVGGRLHQKQFEGYTVEIGANWVEGVGGEKVNPIWTLANQYNLTLSYTDFSNVSANTYSQEWVYYTTHS